MKRVASGPKPHEINCCFSASTPSAVLTSLLSSCPPQIFVQKHSKDSKERWLSGNSLFFRMHRISDVYFVGGFGTVSWVNVAEYTAVKPDSIVMHKPHRILQVDLCLNVSQPLCFTNFDEAEHTAVKPDSIVMHKPHRILQARPRLANFSGSVTYTGSLDPSASMLQSLDGTCKAAPTTQKRRGALLGRAHG